MSSRSGNEGRFGAVGMAAGLLLLAVAASSPLRAGEKTTVDAEKERRQQVVTGFYSLQGQISKLMGAQWSLGDRRDDKQARLDRTVDKARAEAVAKRLETLRGRSQAVLEREPWLREHLDADKMIDDGMHWVSRESVCTKLVVMSNELRDGLRRQRSLQASVEEQQKLRQLRRDQGEVDALKHAAASISGPKGGKNAPPGIQTAPEPPPVDLPPPPPPVPAEKGVKVRKELEELDSDIVRLKAQIAALNALDHIQDDMGERGFFWVESTGFWAAMAE